MTIEKKIFAFFATYNLEIVGKKWFVAYRVPDYSTGKFKKRKYYGQINKYDSVEDRLAECEKIKSLILQNKPLPNFRGSRSLQPVATERNFASVIFILKNVLKDRKININNTTYINYKSMILKLELWLKSVDLADITIGKFNEEMARDFLHYLKINGCANKTHNNYKLILSSLWKDIARNLKSTIAIDNVWIDIKSLKKNTQPFKIYTNEIEKIVEQKLPKFDKQLWLYVLFTHYGFIRGTENRKLKIENIDFENKTICIKSIVSKVSEQRIITIPQPLFAEILAYNFQQYDKNSYIFSSKGFPSEKPAGKNYFNMRWNKFRLKYKISDEFKIYAFKHTGMIKAKQNGIDVKDIQKQAGHHSLDQVNDYLANMNINSLDNLRDKFPKLGEKPKLENNNDELKSMLLQILQKMDS